MALLRLRARFPIIITTSLVYLLCLVYCVTYLAEEFSRIEIKILSGVLAVIFILLNISMYRAVKTPPGTIPDDHEWDVRNHELDNELSNDQTDVEIRARRERIRYINQLRFNQEQQ